ncbi:MAG: exodeoxyribonuclease VII small subunit [Arenicellales bacterium WSBS_2016_MAG_OTU3]
MPNSGWKKSGSKDFEKSLTDLEKIVERMEAGDQSLGTCLKDFERGMLLSRACAEGLKAAERRVEIVIKKHKGFAIEVFDEDGDGDADGDYADDETEAQD